MSRSWWRSAADTLVKIVSTRLDPIRQRESAQFIGGQGWFADQHSVRLQKWDDQWGDLVGKRLARRDLAVSGIEVRKHHTLGKPGAHGRQRLAHIAEQEKLGRRNTAGMGCNGALADINLAVREELPEMIIGPAVAEAEFEHVTIQTPNQVGGQFEASALRLEPANEAVQPAHRHSRGSAGGFAQSFQFGGSSAQLIVHRFNALR